MIEVKRLKKFFHTRRDGILEHPLIVKAVDDISFSIMKGKTLGMVGESGSGKTTVARSIVRLLEPDSGKIMIDGTDISTLNKKALRNYRKNMQIIFQDPYGSLNPRMTVGKTIIEPLKIHTKMNKRGMQERLEELLQLVGLEIKHRDRYPHEFSGGQRQRISIARAIALNPKFIILDEPVSALDVSIQGQILNLLSDLQDKFKITYLFVAHDLAVVDHFCDMIVVMYLGKIVEENSKDGLYRNALHPYTQSLLDSIPGSIPQKHGFSIISGEIPSPEHPPHGCHFHPRCPSAMKICSKEYPEMRSMGEFRVACHLR